MNWDDYPSITADEYKKTEEEYYANLNKKLSKMSLAELEAESDAIGKRKVVALANINQAVKELDLIQLYQKKVIRETFFAKHEVWDWEVRKAYMDLIKQHSIPYQAYENGGVGHAFELWNYRPRFPVETGFYIDSFCVRETLTELVPIENFHLCLPDEKTKEAFEIQSQIHLDPEESNQSRGFLYTTKPIEFSEWDGEYDTGLHPDKIPIRSSDP